MRGLLPLPICKAAPQFPLQPSDNHHSRPAASFFALQPSAFSKPPNTCKSDIPPLFVSSPAQSSLFRLKNTFGLRLELSSLLAKLIQQAQQTPKTLPSRNFVLRQPQNAGRLKVQSSPCKEYYRLFPFLYIYNRKLVARRQVARSWKALFHKQPKCLKSCLMQQLYCQVLVGSMERKEAKSSEGPRFRLDLSFQGQTVNDLQGIVNGQCKFTLHCEDIAATLAQDRKQKIRQLLASKNPSKATKPAVSQPQSSRPHESFQRQPIHIRGNQSKQRERQSEEREERSRTRDRAVQNPANIIKDFIAFNEARARKLSFQPKFNFYDNIFAQYKDVYSMRSGRHEGFLIVNSSPCPPSLCYIKFRAIGLTSDGENDCAVGITFRPQDLVKYNRKIPVDKCMRYFLGSHKLFTGKNSNLVSGNLEGEVMLVVDRPRGKFCIYTRSQLILKRSIPNEFLEEELFVCIELRNGARLQLL